MLNISPVRALRLLGDDTRLRMFTALKRGPAYPGDLARRLGITPAAVSQHLRALRSVGLLRAERQGTRIRYAIRHEALRDLARIVGGVCACDCACCCR